MLKAAPGLGFVVMGCILFILAFYGYRAAILHEDIDADDIKTVSVEADMFGYNTYQGYIIDEFRTSHPEIVNLVADQLAYSQEWERGGVSGGSSYDNRRVVTIRLKGGRTVKRSIRFTQGQVDEILDTLKEEEQMRELLYQLPSNKEIDSGDVYINIGNNTYSDVCYIRYSSMKDLMAVFCAEFNTLTDEQKNRVMEPTFSGDWNWEDEGIMLLIQGTVNHQYFNSRYYVTEDMPRTRRHLLIFWSLECDNRYDNGNENWGGEADDVLQAIQNDLNQNPIKYVTVELQAVPWKDMNRTNRCYEIHIPIARLGELVTLLRERDLMNSREAKRDPYENVRFTDDTYCLHMTVQRNGQYSDDYLYVDVNGLFDLSAEDWETILDLWTDTTSS